MRSMSGSRSDGSLSGSARFFILCSIALVRDAVCSIRFRMFIRPSSSSLELCSLASRRRAGWMVDEFEERRRANDGLTPARLPDEVGCGGGPLRILESEAGFGEAARHDSPTFEHELGFRAERP